MLPCKIHCKHLKCIKTGKKKCKEILIISQSQMWKVRNPVWHYVNDRLLRWTEVKLPSGLRTQCEVLCGSHAQLHERNFLAYRPGTTSIGANLHSRFVKPVMSENTVFCREDHINVVEGFVYFCKSHSTN